MQKTKAWVLVQFVKGLPERYNYKNKNLKMLIQIYKLLTFQFLLIIKIIQQIKAMRKCTTVILIVA